MNMDINEFELVKLLTDEIFAARNISYAISDNTSDDEIYAQLEFGNFQTVTLEWEGGQTFFIINSDTDEMFPGNTISVDEILDIVL